MKWLRWPAVVAGALVLGADAVPYTDDVRPMIARAEQWFLAQPVYDQDACFRVGAGYAGTDWGGVLGGCHEPYYRTGDALLAWGRHVRLFEHWTDAARTTYVAYDFGATPVKHQEYVWDAPGEYDYLPIRYTPDH